MCFCCDFAQIYDFNSVYRYGYIHFSILVSDNNFNFWFQNAVRALHELLVVYVLVAYENRFVVTAILSNNCTHFCNILQYFIENFPKVQLCKPQIK